MGRTVSSVAEGRRHRGAGLHSAIAHAHRDLFARTHSSRYFGGFWFKVFFERGPC